MAQQRFYWLKLMSDFFTQPKIKKLRRIAGGDTYTVIYPKMQLLSLKNGGIIPYEGIEETFADELALTMDETPENVQATLVFMESQGLIEKISEEEFFLPETALLIGSEGASAERVRAHRANKKAELNVKNAKLLQCNTDVTDCNNNVQNSNVELEIEKEKREEKEIYTREDIEESADNNLSTVSTDNCDLQRALDAYVSFRKGSGRPFTDESLKLITQQLDKLAKTDAEKVAIINQSIMYGWTALYPLKTGGSGKGNSGGTKYPYGNTKFCNYKPSNYDMDAIEQAEKELRASY